MATVFLSLNVSCYPAAQVPLPHSWSQKRNLAALTPVEKLSGTSGVLFCDWVASPSAV